MAIRNKSVHPIKIEPILVCMFTYSTMTSKLLWHGYHPFGLNVSSAYWVSDKSHKKFMKYIQIECDKILSNYGN